MMKNKQETTLNEKDSLEDMLSTEKQVLWAYTTAVIEGGNKSIRKTFTQYLSACAENQFSVFRLMQERGYYPVEKAEEESIKESAETFKKFFN